MEESGGILDYDRLGPVGGQDVVVLTKVLVPSMLSR